MYVYIYILLFGHVFSHFFFKDPLLIWTIHSRLLGHVGSHDLSDKNPNQRLHLWSLLLVAVVFIWLVVIICFFQTLLLVCGLEHFCIFHFIYTKALPDRIFSSVRGSTILRVKPGLQLRIFYLFKMSSKMLISRMYIYIYIYEIVDILSL